MRGNLVVVELSAPGNLVALAETGRPERSVLAPADSTRELDMAWDLRWSSDGIEEEAPARMVLIGQSRQEQAACGV